MSSTALSMGDYVSPVTNNMTDVESSEMSASDNMVTIIPTVTGNISVYFLFAVPSIIFIGNLVVVLAIKRSIALQRMFYYLTCSLAVSNILTACLIMPVFIFHHALGDFAMHWWLCCVWVVLDTLLVASSITHIILLAYNTRRALINPLNYRVYAEPRHILVQLSVVWGASLLLSVPHLAVTLGYGAGNEEIGVMKCVWLTTALPHYLAKYVPALVLPFLVACGSCMWTAKDAKQQGKVLDKISSVVENNGVICNGSAIMPNLMVIEAVLEADSQPPVTVSDINTTVAPSTQIKATGSRGKKASKTGKSARAGSVKKGRAKGSANKSQKVPVPTDRVKSKRSSYAAQRQKRLMSSKNDDEEEDEGGQQMSVQAEVHSSDGSSQDGIDKDLSDFDDAESLNNDTEKFNDGFSDMDSVCRSISTNSSCSGFVIDATDSEDSSRKDEDLSYEEGKGKKVEDTQGAAGNDKSETKEKVNGEGKDKVCDSEDQNRANISDDKKVEQDSLVANEDSAQEKSKDNEGADTKEDTGKEYVYKDEDPCEQSVPRKESVNDNAKNVKNAQDIAQDDGITKQENADVPVIEKSGDDKMQGDEKDLEENNKDDITDTSLLAPPRVQHKLDIEAAAHRQNSEGTEGQSPAVSMASGYETLTSEVQSPADGTFQYGNKTPTSVSRQDSGCDNSDERPSTDDEPKNHHTPENLKHNKSDQQGTIPTGKEKLNMPLEEKDIDLIIGPDKEKLINEEKKKSKEEGIDNPAFENSAMEGMPKDEDGTISLSDAIKVRCPSVCSKSGEEDKIEPAEAPEPAKLNSKSNSNDSLMAPETEEELTECKITPGRRSILKRDNSKRNSHRKSVKFASDVGEPKVTKRESRKIVRKGTKHVKVTHPDYARQHSVVGNSNTTVNHTNGHVPTLSRLSMQNKKQPTKTPLSPEVSSSIEYLTKINSVQGKRATQRLKKDRNTLNLVVALLICNLLLSLPYVVVYGINLPYPHNLVPELAVYILQFVAYCVSLVVPVLMVLFSGEMRANCTGVICCMPQEYGNGWGDQADPEHAGANSTVPFGYDLMNGAAEEPIKIEGSKEADKSANGHAVKDAAKQNGGGENNGDIEAVQ